MSRRLVMYVTPWCPGSGAAKLALAEWGVPYTLIDIRQDPEAAGRVRIWTGFESVPTLVIVEGDAVEPHAPPAPLARGASPRGIDRGSILTEPTRPQLRAWLEKQGMLDQ